MSGPLDPTIAALGDASRTLERARASAHEAWDDKVYRTLDARVLSRLETESRLALAALTRADATLQQALQLLKG